MEDAYNELYREFVNLRSICIRQADLLQQLSRGLHEQQGSNVGSFSGMESILVQCSQQNTVHIPDKIPQLRATNQDASPHTGMGHHHHHTAGVSTFSALLAEDMGKLGLNGTHQRKTNKEGEASPKPTSPAVRPPAISGDASYRASFQPDRLPSGLLDSMLDNQPLFLSQMELRSQVCHFCHAIFPGHTATQGEFMRHLHMHVA